MKIIAFAVSGMILLSSCEWFGPAEKHKTESDRTTYRSAEESWSDTVTPAPQKVPGESRR